MRHDDVVAVAAIGTRAEVLRLQAHQIVAAIAGGARATADPWVGDPPVAHRGTVGVGAHRRDAANDLMPHGQGQLDAAFVQRRLVAAAEVEIAVPDV